MHSLDDVQSEEQSNARTNGDRNAEEQYFS